MRPLFSPRRRRAHEAAKWVAKLSSPVVTTRDLAAFQRWRRRSGAEAAYAHAAATMRRMGRLADDPDIRAQIAQIRPRADRPGASRRQVVAVSAAFGGAACLFLLITMGIGGGTQVFMTPIGGRQTVRLADGTSLTLDADTRLSARLNPLRRQVTLDRGRVLVDVAHDATRPFTVLAGGAQVVARGTRFTVKREGQDAVVVLLRGAVDVGATSRGGRVWRLAPGETVDTHAGRLAPADLSSTLQWTQGRIVLNDAAPASAVAEINRYARRPLLLDEALTSTPAFSGVFRAGDEDGFIAAVTRLRGWRAVPQKDGSILLSGARPTQE